MGRIITNSKQDELQTQMVQKGLEFYNSGETCGYFDLSIRFGKCKTTIELLKTLWSNAESFILIAYPDNKLKETWVNEQKLWGSIGRDVYYTNFSSLKKYTEYSFDHVVIDEFHAVSDNELEFCQEIIKNSAYTTCLSGTVDDETKKRWGIKEIGRYTTKQGQDDGILADYRVTVHLVNLDTKVKTKDNSGKERTEKQRYDAYTWVIEKNKREGKDSMFLSLARNRISLNSIGKRDYVKGLLKQMGDKRVIVFTGQQKASESLGIPFFHSKSDKKDTTFQDFLDGKINKLALSAIGKVGVTYPQLNGCILSNFTYNEKETAQILQRAIKLDYDGKVADLHLCVLNEQPEIKKASKSLGMLDITKIDWLKPK